MYFVSSAFFVLLVNVSPMDFFKGTHGIRQGYPLSLYIFLLIIEGLSPLLSKSKVDNLIKCVKVYGSIVVNHTLFFMTSSFFDVGYFLNGLLSKDWLTFYVVPWE